MQPNARMTFRFDPPVKPKAPAPAPKSEEAEVAPSAATLPQHREEKRQEAPSVSAVSYEEGTLLDDPYTLEQLIRRAAPAVPSRPAEKEIPIRHPLKKPEERTEKGIAGDALLEADLAGWDLGDPEQAGSGWTSAGRRHDGPSWWRAFATVAAAIATGALFGYLVLTLFAGEPFLPSKTADGSAAPAQASPAAGGVTAGDAPSGAAEGALSGGELLPESYYMLQYGVFRSEDSMNAALEELKAKGLPAVADRSDGFRVFAGTGGTKEEAEQLASQMPGTAVFIKPVTLEFPALTAEERSGQLGAFMRLSGELAKELAALSANALLDEMPQALGETGLNAVREIHRQWLGTITAADRLDGQAGDAAKAVIQNVNAAMVSVDDYGKKVSRFHLWRIQEDVTAAVWAGNALRGALSPASN